MERSAAEMEEEFYSKPFFLSYSGLSKMLYSPSVFYRHYVLQQREEKLESHLIDGKVIHCLLLDDGSFDEKFTMAPTKVPTGNTRLVIDRVFSLYKEQLKNEKHRDGELDVFEDFILEVLLDINLHQSLADDKKGPFKTGDEKRIEKITTEESKYYFEFLKNRRDRDILDEETLARCNESVAAVRAHTDACILLGILRSELDNIDVYNEIYLESESKYAFGLKGVVDNIKVDHDAKVIYVNDLKTSGKTVSEFKDSVEFFNYWAQAMIYMGLVDKMLGLDNYKMLFNFVVIDKYKQVYCFEVSQETLTSWGERLEEKLKAVEWHYKNRNYSLPYEFLTSKVYL